MTRRANRRHGGHSHLRCQSPFKANEIREQEINYASGQLPVWRGQIRNRWCSRCGSRLITTFAAHPDYYGLPLGGLDDDPGVKPTNHVYVVDKAPWHDITDGLPRHPQGPPT